MPSALVCAGRAAVRRSRRGLFAGKTVLFGNSVSEDGGNRNRRDWKPNVQNKALYSEALDRMVRLKITTSALRTIDRMGGLDAYLLGTPERKLDSDVGMQLRQHIEAALDMRAASQAAAQLPQPGTSTTTAGRGAPTGSRSASGEPDEATALAGPQPDDAAASSAPAGAQEQEPQPARRARGQRRLAYGDEDRPRFIVQEEYQTPRWDGSMKTVPRRVLRYPKWQL